MILFVVLVTIFESDPERGVECPIKSPQTTASEIFDHAQERGALASSQSSRLTWRNVPLTYKTPQDFEQERAIQTEIFDLLAPSLNTLSSVEYNVQLTPLRSATPERKFNRLLNKSEFVGFKIGERLERPLTHSFKLGIKQVSDGIVMGATTDGQDTDYKSITGTSISSLLADLIFADPETSRLAEPQNIFDVLGDPDIPFRTETSYQTTKTTYRDHRTGDVSERVKEVEVIQTTFLTLPSGQETTVLTKKVFGISPAKGLISESRSIDGVVVQESKYQRR